MEKQKINIPPIVFVITASAVAVICLAAIIFLNQTSSFKDEFFKEEYRRCEATCTSKSVTSGSDGETYYLDIDFTIKQNGYDTSYSVTLAETDPRFSDIDQGSTLEIFYHVDDPYTCRPAMLYQTPTTSYIILAAVIVICLFVIYHHAVVIARNRHKYVPKFESPDEIGYMGEAGAETGLDDKEIDYSAGQTQSNNPMDSFVDPFAVYTGYDDNEDQQQTQNNYFDPNAGFENMPSYEDEQNYPSMSEEDLNNPFAANINNDPNNPYNAGTYDAPVSMFDPNSDYNSAEIYGDSSFGTNPDNY